MNQANLLNINHMHIYLKKNGEIKFVSKSNLDLKMKEVLL